MSAVKKTYHKIKNYEWGKLFFELIVVFLGITAGFVLNNWRMEQEEKKLEEKYISSFLQDINYDIPELEDAIKTDSVWLARSEPLMISIINKKIEIDSAQSMIKRIVSISKIDAHSSTYEEISNSGNLNIISDYELKAQIVDYYLALGGVGFIDDYFHKYFSDFVMPFVLTEYSVLTGEFNNTAVVNSVRFSNVVAGYYSLVQQRLAAYKKLLADCYLLRDELLKR
ncbi:MAG: hypothetical protein OQK56_01430 [Ignavibacteriaceae bacterium]|jgi:hypothetical protein|nr:hypothetical protein [Ignavibacteriaceae bacterium]